MKSVFTKNSISSSTLSLSKKIESKKKLEWHNIKMNYDMYLLMIPGLLFLLLFRYLPMYGILIAFQDFNIFEGILKSEWIGLANFTRLFQMKEFYTVFTNTLVISIYKIAFLFPAPIVLALLLNEVKNMLFKRTVQTVIYLPHFLSWVIIAGLFINILSTSSGLINNVIKAFGGEPIAFLMDNRWFRSILVFSAGWKESGWNTIVYIAAIAGVEQEVYEAAIIDGASRIKQMIHITIPSILSTIVMLFILRLGSILEAGTQQILVMYNPVVYKTADIIGTYVYRTGLGNMEYSFSTAVGLFNSLVGFILVISGNNLSKKMVQRSIW